MNGSLESGRLIPLRVETVPPWITRAATAKDPEMNGYTDQHTVFPDDEKAFTKSPVLITKGQSWLKGVGMQVDSRAQTYVLESQAFAVLESKSAKKKP